MTGNKQYIHTHIHPLSSLLRLCSYPTVVEQKTTHFAATFLSLWKGQHYRFTDSILLNPLLLYGKTTSFQPEGDMPSLETKLYRFLGRWMPPDVTRWQFKRKRTRRESVSPFLHFSFRLLTQAIREQRAMCITPSDLASWWSYTLKEEK